MIGQMSKHSGQPKPAATAALGFATEAAKILDEVRCAMAQNREGAHAAALRLVTLLASHVPDEPACARGGLAPWQKRKVDRYLKENLERPLHLSDLAGQVVLSVSHFCRAFKEAFGDTPHAYIVRLRVQLAQELMLTTEDSLSQIALACGLSDQAHLSKLFRRVVGEPPNAWRRRNLTDDQAVARSGRRRRKSARLRGLARTELHESDVDRLRQ
jgi:AraC family transcriptional regulator